MVASDGVEEGKVSRGLRTDKAGVEAAGQGNVSGSVDERASVREERQGVRSTLETQQEPIEFHFAVGLQTALQLGKIDGAVVFMNLHGVAAA